MKPSDPNTRRRGRLAPAPESLESRELMTAGAGNTIAIFQGEVAQPGGTAEVKIVLDPANFTLPKNRIALGVDAASPNGSSLEPAVQTAGHAHGTPGGLRARSIGPGTDVLIAQLGQGRRSPSGPLTYQATVSGKNQSAGKFLVGFYLPGDANGDGTVDQADIKAIRGRLGSVTGDPSYAFNADSDRDGRISFRDMMLGQKNLGVKTTLAPVLSANLDPASDTGAADRVTAATSAHYTGVASGGATITFKEVNNRVPDVSTVADADGNYSIVTPLAQGSNQFQVTMTDTSGQTISGTIAAVYSSPVLAGLDTSKK
jgi:hypothetical protein